MAFTHKIKESWAGNGQAIDNENSYSADAQASRDLSVPDATTDMLVELTLDVSTIKSIYISSTKAITLETNNASAPADTINLTANKPYVWTSDSYFTNLLTTDVTALYLTNASGAAATFRLEVVFDPTP